jgi:uncharacterized protein (DUF1697 family)
MIYVLLLRAVNVGGTGKLPMADLKRLCLEAGFAEVETYIASGNVVCHSDLPSVEVKAALEKKLLEYAGKPVGVVVRTAAELAAVLDNNPFREAAGNRAMAIFLDEAPPVDALERASGIGDEEMALGVREIYVHYPSGMGTSKLKIAAAKTGTARNLNTVAKLVEMSRK